VSFVVVVVLQFEFNHVLKLSQRRN